MSTKHFELLVVGGGSGGLAAARRSAQYGASVALIEQAQLGGTCVNVGCVPKKVMWHAAQLNHGFHDAAEYGFEAVAPKLDWTALVTRREAYLRRLNGIYGDNLERDNVQRIDGQARFIGPRQVEVDGQQLEADRVVIATGAQPMAPSDIPGHELGIDSDGFFGLAQQPRSAIVVGAGYIAVELAGMLQALGTNTHLVFRRDTVLRSFDQMLGPSLIEQMQADGLVPVPNAQIASLRRCDSGITAEFEGDQKAITAEVVIWAIGREPNVAGLNLAAAGVSTDARGRIVVDADDRTSAEEVYALGDVTGPPELTPVAIAQGRALAGRLYGGTPDARVPLDQIPTVIFSHPPIGTVGLSEQQARAEHGDAVTIYNSEFRSLYYGVMENKRPTRFKLICVGADQRVVGCHLLGQGADEILQGFAVAIRMGATKADFDRTIAIHPTSAEELVTLR